MDKYHKAAITGFIFAIVIIGALLLWARSAMAAPYLVSDSAASDNVTSCQFESFQLPCVLDATKSIRVDLASLPSGSHSIRAQFCAGVWGCSAWSTPFAFTKPALNGPQTIRLSK